MSRKPTKVTNFAEAFHLNVERYDVVTGVGTTTTTPMAYPTYRDIPVLPYVVGAALGLGVAHLLPAPDTPSTPGPTG
jgi:hypothetical protein